VLGRAKQKLVVQDLGDHSCPPIAREGDSGDSPALPFSFGPAEDIEKWNLLG
jgi:hypothetical protein